MSRNGHFTSLTLTKIMKKSQSTPPRMGNNGGTAFVRINGKRIYLGKFGSPEAAQNYARCVAEWAISNADPEQARQAGASTDPTVFGREIAGASSILSEDSIFGEKDARRSPPDNEGFTESFIEGGAAGEESKTERPGTLQFADICQFH